MRHHIHESQTFRNVRVFLLGHPILLPIHVHCVMSDDGIGGESATGQQSRVSHLSLCCLRYSLSFDCLSVS